MKFTHYAQQACNIIAAAAGAAALAFPQYAPTESGIAAIALAIAHALSVQSETSGDKAVTK